MPLHPLKLCEWEINGLLVPTFVCGKDRQPQLTLWKSKGLTIILPFIQALCGPEFDLLMAGCIGYHGGHLVCEYRFTRCCRSNKVLVLQYFILHTMLYVSQYHSVERLLPNSDNACVDDK